MPLKRLQLPGHLSYPLQIIETHVAAGQSVAKGDPLYTLLDADGRRGMMRAPMAGTISEGPVDAGAAFNEPVPVVGIEVDADHDLQAADGKPSGEQKPTEEDVTVDIETDLSKILGQAETASFAKGRRLWAFRASIAQALHARGHDEEAAELAAGSEPVEKLWHETNGSDEPEVPTRPVAERGPETEPAPSQAAAGGALAGHAGSEQKAASVGTISEEPEGRKPFGWVLALLLVAGFAWGLAQVKLNYFENWNTIFEVLVSLAAAVAFFIPIVLVLAKSKLVTDQQLVVMWIPMGTLAVLIPFVPAHEMARWNSLVSIQASEETSDPNSAVMKKILKRFDKQASKSEHSAATVNCSSAAKEFCSHKIRSIVGNALGPQKGFSVKDITAMGKITNYCFKSGNSYRYQVFIKKLQVRYIKKDFEFKFDMKKDTVNSPCELVGRVAISEFERIDTSALGRTSGKTSIGRTAERNYDHHGGVVNFDGDDRIHGEDFRDQIKYGWRVCNRISRKVYYAAAYRSLKLGGGMVWTTAGWYGLKPRDCAMIQRRIENPTGYIYVSNKGRPHLKGGALLCAKKQKPFRYEGHKKTCPAGYQNLPFKKVNLGNKPSFTLNIK